ncbi:hypothetical protein SMA90_27060, partial [Escherichia coli]
KEEVTIGQESLQVIAQKADGAMRDALTLLDQCIAVSGKDVTYQQVISNLNVLDREYYFKLTAMALEGSYENMLVLFDEILTRGFNALHFIGGLSSHFRDLLVCKQPESLPLLEYGEETARRYRKQSQACSLPFLFRALSICTQAEAGYKQSNLPRLHIEMALIRLSQARNHSEAKEGRKEEREAPVPPQEKDVSGQSLQESIGNPVSTKNEQQAPSA